MPRVKDRKRLERVGATLDLGARQLVAIDPGDAHVGWAQFVTEHDGFPVCAVAHQEYTPFQAVDMLQRLIEQGAVGVIVLEKFQLYADKAIEQTGSEFETSQMIGVIKYLVRRQNEQAKTETDGDPWAVQPVQLVMQGAAIKKPTRAQMKARGIVRLTRANTHAGDAEEHGWCALLRNQEGQ